MARWRQTPDHGGMVAVLSRYETRHEAHAALYTHRHRGAYAALVLDGGYLQSCVEGPVPCVPGTLLLHPRFHAHGNRFERGGARVANLQLPHAWPIRRLSALRVANLREAAQVFTHADLPALQALAAASVPIDCELLPWQAAMRAALRDSERPVADIAAELGVSAAHASRALQRSFGMGPLALRRELRWQRALDLLEGDASLATVAADAGFADQSHLSRVVRAHSGSTPARLRREIKSGQYDTGPVLLQSS